MCLLHATPPALIPLAHHTFPLHPPPSPAQLPSNLSPTPTPQDVLSVLVEVGAMEPNTLRILPLGLVARGINCNNELWMAAAMTHPEVVSFTAPQLAAFVGALQCTDLLKRPMSIWSSYQVGTCAHRASFCFLILALTSARENPPQSVPQYRTASVGGVGWGATASSCGEAGSVGGGSLIQPTGTAVHRPAQAPHEHMELATR
jgi:hypothetical protein